MVKSKIHMHSRAMTNASKPAILQKARHFSSAIKMGAGYQFIVVSLLLSLKVGHCILGCGAYERPSSTDIKLCIQIEEIFETALLSDKNNLHILRDTFLSSSHPSPHLLDVVYIEDDSDSTAIKVTWTISKVFTVVESIILHNFQSGIMTLVYYGEGILFPETIYLHLNISGYDLNPIEKVYGAIIITQRLKPYAISQGKLSNWDGEHKGYVISELNQYKIIIIFIATSLLYGIGIAVSLKLVRSLARLEESYNTDVKLSLFWTSIMVLGFTNSIEILFLIIFYVIPSENTSTPICIVKTAVIICTGIGAVAGAFIVEKVPTNPSKEGSCYCSLSRSGRAEYCCALYNLFLFAFFISLSITTTIAMMLVHPILILSTISYISTSMFSLIVLFAIPNSFGLIVNRWVANRNYNEFRKWYSYLSNTLLYTTAMVAISFIALLYLMTLSKVDYAYNNANILQDVSSFLPSIIPGIVGYYAKKKLLSRSKRRFKEAIRFDDLEEYELTSVMEKTNLSTSPLTLVERDRDLGTSNSDNDNETTKLLSPDTEETEL